MKRLTIIDIAKHLGVSKSTVSRALRDSAEIGKETKQKILEYAREHNFTPSLQARSLRGGKSHIVGVIVPKIAHPYFSRAISGIQDYLYPNNYSAFIIESAETYIKEKQAISELSSANVDGIIISVSEETDNYIHLESFFQSKNPLIFFDRTIEGLKCAKVIINHEKAAYNATSFLIRKGAKNIFHFSGPSKLTITKDRIRGYKKALEEKFIFFSEDKIREIGNNKESVSSHLKAILDSGTPIDAISCFNDEVAVEAILTLKQMNIKVPEQIQVIGFNNEDIARVISPGLTTINHPAYSMGMKAAELFISAIKNRGKLIPNTIELKTEIVIRDSTL